MKNINFENTFQLFLESGGTHSNIILQICKSECHHLCFNGFKARDRANWHYFIRQVLESFAQKLQRKLDFNNLNCLFWGLSGLGTLELREKFQKEMKKVLPSCLLSVFPDYLSTFFANPLDKKKGCLLILGTGCILVQIDPYQSVENRNTQVWELGEMQLRVARKEGWGVDFSDTGSGAYFGKKLLELYFSSIDEEISEQPIVQAIEDFYACNKPREIAEKILSSSRKDSEFARLFPLFKNFLHEKEEICLKIYENALDILAAKIGKLTDKKAQLFTSGGIFKALPELARDITAVLRKKGDNRELIAIPGPGSLGALKIFEKFYASGRGLHNDIAEKVEPVSVTELIHPETKDLSNLLPEQFCNLFISEEARAIQGLKQLIPELSEVIKKGAGCLEKGGRILYFGCGTSGRLGVLDASEIPPTFSDESSFTAFIAGGERAITRAMEGAEDNLSLAAEDFQKAAVSKNDLVIGISSSGSTPYTLEILRLARQKAFATTVLIASNYPASLDCIDYFLFLGSGPEILTGSTRLKAGTCTKVLLNAISTGIMIRVGKTYHNYMVDLKASNNKLIKRSIRLLQEICDCSEEEARKAITEGEGNLKVAIVIKKLGLNLVQAFALLKKHKGQLQKII
ncbi:N-acetylmuramic acid 6-phosphate etherase [Candidatus Riflebacteria bacterium]